MVGVLGSVGLIYSTEPAGVYGHGWLRLRSQTFIYTRKVQPAEESDGG